MYKNVARWRLIRHHSEEAGVEGGQWPVDNGAGDRSQAVVAMPQSSQKNIQKKTQRNHHIELVSVLMYYSHSIAVS